MDKIKIAFIKYAGLSLGGTEKQLIRLAANLDKNIFDVDYYWCKPGIDLYANSNINPEDTSLELKKYLSDNGVKTVEFYVKKRDLADSTHVWIGTNFWEVFDYKKYAIIQIAKSGHTEYPFNHIPRPMVEWNIFGSVDPSPNIYKTISISKWIYDIWISSGGNPKKGMVIYPGITESVCPEKCIRQKRGEAYEITLGFHQRPSDDIFSSIPLKVLRNIQNKLIHRKLKFMILGGSDLYKKQVTKLGLTNVQFIKPTSDWSKICEFLSRLDIYCHGRKDGECHGTAIQEAMLHGLPVVSHTAPMNGHIEIIADCGKVCRNAKEYAKYLENLIIDEDKRLFLGKKARQRSLQKFIINNIKKDFEKLYLELIKDENAKEVSLQKIPPNGYRTIGLSRLFLNKISYGIHHPRQIKSIILRTIDAIESKIKIILRKIFQSKKEYRL